MDEPEPLGKYETGSKTAMPIFKEFLLNALTKKDTRPFKVSENITMVMINPKTGMKADFTSKETIIEAFKNRQERFPSIDHFMIGRGLIADPFLPQMIKGNTTEYPKDRWKTFKAFHDTIYVDYDAYLQGPTPIKMKMLGFWELFSQSFSNPQKTYKKIKKASNPYKYQAAVAEIFSSEEKL